MSRGKGLEAEAGVGATGEGRTGGRAAVRRAFAATPDAARLPLARAFAELAGAGAVPAAEAAEILAEYLFDPAAGAILATTETRARWLDGSLFRWIGPGNAVPHDDQIAALVCGPVIARGGVLADAALARRFAPRADDAIAIAVAALPAAEQQHALERLAADVGPDAPLLALSTVQCGRVLAWSPHLLETQAAGAIVGALLALLDPARPKPLLELAARALGPIAAAPGPTGERVRAAALAGLDVERVPPASFADEIAAIGKPRRVPDLDRWSALPRREVAEACAYILGFAAPMPRDRFALHRALVLDRPSAPELWAPFVDGLVAAAHVPALCELAAGLLGDGGGSAETALGLAARVPLDPIADELVAELDEASATRRALACAAVELLADDPAIDGALVARLSDPSPEVAAAAARALLARGRRDAIAEHAGRETHSVRAAVAHAALGDLDVPVIGELVRGLVVEDVSDAEPTPVLRLLADVLLGSTAGLEVAADLIGGVAEAAGLLALACAPDAERDAGVLAPPGPRARFARAALEVEGEKLGALALYLLARVSAGDATIAEVVATALADTHDAAPLVAALAELRVASDVTASALAPLVAPDQPIGSRVIAAAACGRALPRSHAAWSHVRELLELGTIARAAAWSALRDRARRA